MSLNIALANALTGLRVNQRALDVTAQNVANVNTAGYTRKIVEQSALVIGGQGAGVQISEITRRVHEYMIKDMRGSLSELGETRIDEEFYGRMQDLFGSLQSDSSVGALIGDFATKFQAFSVDPQDVSLRIEVINAANALAQRINQTSAALQDLRLEADRKLAESIETVNDKLTEIQELNIRIAENIALDLGPGELQDQRDVALSAIAEEMDINYFFRDNGEVVIYTATGRALLDRTANTLSHASASSMSSLTVYDGSSGAIGPITLGTGDITTEITGGRMAAYVRMRDTVVPSLHGQFEELTTALHDEINALHNQGASFPGYDSLTGTRRLAGGDTPAWTGTVRVAVLDADGEVVEVQNFNLATYATMTAFVTAVDGMTNATASINASGNVVFTATGGNKIAINEMTSAVTVGSETVGLSNFLGLNDFFQSSNDYDFYTSAERSSRTTALGLTGTLTFQGSWGTTTVNYAVGDSLSTIAAAINANATLAAQGITATASPSGGGYRLRLSDNGGDNFFVTDSGALVSTLNVRARDGGVASTVAVKSDLLADPSRLAHALLSGGALVAGDVALSSGDNTVAQQLADRFNQDVDFDATGLLAGGVRTLAEYGSAIVSLNSTQAKQAVDDLAARQFLFDTLHEKTTAISGVNLDEEMANMIILENAYAAAARVISTTSEMFDMLTQMLR
jgi:flagellar hook-associated protein 1 FlgK